MMKTLILTAALLPVAAVHAGETGQIDWHTVDGGGTQETAGGNWNLKATLGQPDATEAGELAGGGWQLTGGFWAFSETSGPAPGEIFSDRFEAPLTDL